MKDQINTIREGIKAALEAEVFVDKPVRRALLDSLTALSDLESHLAQYEAGDMASAAAQGFRDGVASVAKQPHVPEADCGNIDWKAQYEHQKRRAEMWIAKYEADIGPLEKAGPVAQQPQAEAAFDWPAATLIVRDCCEAEKFDPDHPDAVCISVQDLTEIVQRYAAPVAQQPQARPDFADEWTGYLKDGETPFERFLRERKDVQSVLKLYQRALEENESLKAQQPQAEAVQYTRADLDRAYSAGLVEGERLAIQQAEAVPPGYVLVPLDVLVAASESLGNFVSDHGWTDADMRAMDNLYAAIAQQKGQP